MEESSDRAQRRDARERELIAHLADLALLAPTPELLRKVIALQLEDASEPSPEPDRPVASASTV